MQISDLSIIDSELNDQLLDFVFSVRNLLEARGCRLKIVNNVLKVVIFSGEVEGTPKVVITTKQRTHINCILEVFGDVNLETTSFFHLKNQLELIRQLIKSRLQLFFKEKWEEVGFFFQSERFFESFKDVWDILKDITLTLKNYINQFVDIEFVGAVYDSGDRSFFIAETEEDEDMVEFFSKPALTHLETSGAHFWEKKFSDHWVIVKRFSNYLLCLVFKGEPHPIYRVAVSFLLSEILMLFSSIRWAHFHQEVSHEFMKGFISALEAKDIYTRGHSEGVSFYSEIIGKALGLSSKELKELKLAAILHDIGKVGIPDSILFKPGRLSDREYGIIKLHSVIGAELLRKIKRFSQFAPIVKAHHERWDGKGYPDGLKAEEIPFFSRIIAVADAYDAMLGDRVYRKAKTKEEAIKELEKCAGSQFDPYIVSRCVSALRDSGVFKPRYHTFVPATIDEVRKSYYFVDTLTGVKNSYALFKDVEDWKTPFYLVFFDIKKFKFFNIKEGLVKGNEVLAKFAQQLNKHFNTQYIYRIGGDDFLVKQDSPPDFKNLTRIKKQMEKEVGFGIRYEVRRVESRALLEKVVKELKLLSYCDFILEEQFDILSRIYEKVAIWNKKKRLIKLKGLKFEEARGLVNTNQVKPLFYQDELIGYMYASKRLENSG